MRLFPKLFSVFCAPVCAIVLLAATAQACPMCSLSIAEDDVLPHAYMYSIIFMLTMPAVVFGGIGTAIYLKYRKLGATAFSGESLGETARASEAELVTQA